MQNQENDNEPELRVEGTHHTDLKRNPFKAPEGYFEDLTPRIMDQVRNSEEIKAQPEFRWNRFLLPSFGTVAIVLVAWFFLQPKESSTLDFDTVLASLSIEELTEFADLKPNELVSYDLVDYNQVSFGENELTEEEIIEYLSTEDEIELNTIIDEIEI